MVLVCAADVARDDRHRAELAHRARVAEDDAVEQAPLDVRQRDAPERSASRRRRARRAASSSLGALRLHQRDQLARDEREGDEHRREHDAGHGEDDLDVVRRAATGRTSPAAPNSSTKIRPAITGETENGRSISVISRLLPRNSNLAIAQAAATPKTRLSGTAIAAASSVSRIAASASGSTSAAR